MLRYADTPIVRYGMSPISTFVPLRRFGAVTTRTLTVQPREGHFTTRTDWTLREMPGLLRRYGTVLRRAGGHVVQEQKIIRVHDMEVNLVKRTVTLGGEEVRLTAKEFDLLQMFITNRGRPFSRKEMLEAVWKYDDYTGDARTVDVHIRRLREKIERNPDEPEFIFTKWKVGYYFTDKD